jgi:hypothetical protein
VGLVASRYFFPLLFGTYTVTGAALLTGRSLRSASPHLSNQGSSRPAFSFVTALRQEFKQIGVCLCWVCMNGFPVLSENWRKPMSAWLGKIFYFAVRSCLACAS